jgi:serine/threonine-protein kinase
VEYATETVRRARDERTQHQFTHETNCGIFSLAAQGHPMPQLTQGQVIPGNYRIERELGQGGMGTVYQATDLASGMTFAIKVLHEELRRHPVIPKRFVQEAMAAGVLVTPHAVKIRATGALADGTPFIVMEYLDGVDLGTAAKRSGGRLSVERALSLLDQAAEALQEAHAKGIVHRDLKPDNIFIIAGPQGEFVKVVDFGISKIVTRDEGAKLTSTGMTVGTPQYMAPEQLRGARDLDGRADVYALGIMLYEVLAGVRPFDGFTYEDVILKVVTETPAPLKSYRPDIPPDLIALIDRTMARDRAQRVSSMNELRQLLAPFWASPARAQNQLAANRSLGPQMARRRVASMAPETTLPLNETVGSVIAGGAQQLSASGAHPMMAGGVYGNTPPPPALSRSSSNLGPALANASLSQSGMHPSGSLSNSGIHPNAALGNSGIHPNALSSSGIMSGAPISARENRSSGRSKSVAAPVITVVIVGLIVTAVVALLVLGGAGAWFYLRSEQESQPSAAPSSGPTTNTGRDENVKSVTAPKRTPSHTP